VFDNDDDHDDGDNGDSGNDDDNCIHIGFPKQQSQQQQQLQQQQQQQQQQQTDDDDDDEMMSQLELTSRQTMDRLEPPQGAQQRWDEYLHKRARAFFDCGLPNFIQQTLIPLESSFPAFFTSIVAGRYSRIPQCLVAFLSPHPARCVCIGIVSRLVRWIGAVISSLSQ
jgi:type II secretory pathway pseudopilin PulG